jgi:hypothetical protein
MVRMMLSTRRRLVVSAKTLLRRSLTFHHIFLYEMPFGKEEAVGDE